ncbi:acyltransferase [soil metagenome]
MNPDAVVQGEPAQRDRLECIDGIRGWAALMVVFSHLWGQFAKHVVPLYDHPVLRAISDGHLAVLIFFVLSGVALSLRFVRKPQPVSIVGLVAARYVRLVVPILGTTLIVYLLIFFGVAGSSEAARLANSEIFAGARHGMQTTMGNVLSFSFYSVLFDYIPRNTFNWSLWTMPIEFVGSLFIFALLFLFSKLPRLGQFHRMMIVCMLTIGLLIISKQLAACFTAGYVLAELVHSPEGLRKLMPLVSILFMAASFVLRAVAGKHDDGSYALLAIGGVMAVLFWPAAKRFFSNGLSRWLGRVSFPLYLIHVPVIGALGGLYVALLDHKIAADLATHITVVVALASCLISARLLLPMEALSIQWSRTAGRLRLPWWPGMPKRTAAE